MSEMCTPKTIKISLSFSKLLSVMSRMFILTPISYVSISPGSAEAYVGWGGNLKNRLMVSCVGNSCTKNYYNLIIRPIDKFWSVFMPHSVVLAGRDFVDAGTASGQDSTAGSRTQILPNVGYYWYAIKFLRAKAECFARLCHRLGVCLSVCLSHSWSVSKRCKLGSRNLHCGLPQSL